MVVGRLRIVPLPQKILAKEDSHEPREAASMAVPEYRMKRLFRSQRCRRTIQQGTAISPPKVIRATAVAAQRLPVWLTKPASSRSKAIASREHLRLRRSTAK